jgi:hypothetical protein
MGRDRKNVFDCAWIKKLLKDALKGRHYKAVATSDRAEQSAGLGAFILL